MRYILVLFLIYVVDLDAQITQFERVKFEIIKSTTNRINYYLNNPSEIDPINFYEPYKNDKYQIFVDTIFFNKSADLFFSFILIRKERNSKVVFDGRALIGIIKNEEISIYPVVKYNAIAYLTKESAMTCLKDCYFNKLSKTKDRYGDRFMCNVSDKDFWSKSLFFKKVSDNLFYFQTQLGKNNEYLKIDYSKCK